MARRSREEAIIRAITALAFSALGAWMFVPQMRVFMLAAGSIALLVFTIWIGWRLTRFKSSRVFVRNVNWAELGVQSQPSADKATLSAQLRDIDWFQFEKLIGLVYQSRDFSVKRLGGANPDGGVDLIVEVSNERFVVQCKQWNKWTVGVRQLREFLGTLTDSGIPKGVFVTMRGYTDEAREFAQKHGITLLDERDIVTMIHEAGESHAATITKLLNDKRKFCPKCEREMVKRTAGRGQNAGKIFWGCSGYPRCKFIMGFEAKQ